MDAKSLSTIALRVLAIYLIVIGLTGIPSLVELFAQMRYGDAPQLEYRFYSAAVFSPLVIGVLIWLLTSRLVKWMIDQGGDSAAADTLNALAAQTVAFVTLGTFFAIKSLSIVLAQLSATAAYDYSHGGWVFWSNIAELFLGIALIVGAKSLTRLFRWFRNWQ